MNTNTYRSRRLFALLWVIGLALAFLWLPMASLFAHASDGAASSSASYPLPKASLFARASDAAASSSSVYPLPRASLAFLTGTPPTITKSSSVFTVTFNEDFTYTVIFTVPAGTTISNVTLIDNLPDDSPNTEPNFTYINATAIGPLPGVGAQTVPTNVVVSNGNHTLSWALGTITNVSASPFTYTTLYRVRANSGQNRIESGLNSAVLSYVGGNVGASTAVTVARAFATPGQFDYSADDASDTGNNVDQLRAGDVVTFTLFVTNTSVQGTVSTAYDLIISDTLPNWLIFGGPLPGTPAPDTIDSSSGSTIIAWRATTADGSQSSLNALAPDANIAPLSFTATVTADVSAGRQDNNRVQVTWRDLPSDDPPQQQESNVQLRSRNVTVFKGEVDAVDPQARLVVNETITYTIDITIPAGTSVYSPAFVLDTLSDGLNYGGEVTHSLLTQPAIVAPAGNNTQITWNFNSNVNAATDLTLTFVFTAYSDGTLVGGPINKGQSLNNNANARWNIGSGSGVNNPVTPQSNANVQFVRPDIPPTKISTPPTVITSGGQLIEYRVQNVRNGSGTADTTAAIAFDVRITDTLPAGFSFVASDPTPDGMFMLGHSVVLTWNVVPSLPIGYYLPGITTTNVSYIVSATAPITLSAGTFYTNNFVVEYSDQPGAIIDEQTYIFTASKSLGVDFVERVAVEPSSEVRIGDLITYTITDTVPAGSIVYWPQHRSDLPRGVQFISGSMLLTGTTFVSSSIPLTTTIGTQERVLWWTATMSNLFGVNPLVVTSTFNARLSAIDTSGAIVYSSTNEFRNPTNLNMRPRIDWNTDDVSAVYVAFADATNTASHALVQPFLADSIFNKRFGGSTLVGASSIVTYHVVITNTGRGSAYDIAISDTLPAGMSYVDAIASGRAYSGTVFSPTLLATPNTGDTGTLGWVIDAIAPGDGNSTAPTTQFTLTYRVQVTNTIGAGRTLTNVARIADYSSLPGEVPFERHYNFHVEAMRSVTLTTPLATISKTVSAVTANWLDPITYTLIFPQPPITAALYNVLVTDTVPAGIIVGGVSTSGGVGAQAGFSGNVVTATATTVASLSQMTVVITGSVQSGATGSLTNTARLEWDAAASGAGHHGHTSLPVTTTILLPDVQISKSGPSVVLPGTSFVYTIAYTNTGLSSAAGVRIQDDLPNLAQFVSYNATPPLSLDAQPDPLNWNVGALGSGQSGTLWVTVTVPSTTSLGSILTNTVSISTVTPGDVSSNNAMTVTAIVNGPSLQVVKTADVSSVDPTGQIVYTIIYSNTGALAATSVVVSETYDANVTFVAANPAPNIGNNVWNTPSTLNPGQSRTIVITVTAAAALPNGLSITNTAQVRANNAMTVQATNIVNVNSAAVLMLQKIGNSATQPGATLVYRITYGNLGNAPANNAWLTETYPSQLTFVSASPPPSIGNNRWNLGTLTPSFSNTIVVTLSVGAGVQSGIPFTNTVSLNSNEDGPINATFSTQVGQIFLPLLMRNFSTLPNLVVQNIVVTPPSPTANQSTIISVTIANLGTQTVPAGFWIDLYVDPTSVPQPGQPWNAIAPVGKAWLLRNALAPGQSLTLDTTMPDDPNNPGAVYSNWPGWFTTAGAHTLYAQVDAFGGSIGLVVELDESDNLYGPLAVTVNAGPAPNVEGDVTPTPQPPLDPRSP